MHAPPSDRALAMIACCLGALILGTIALASYITTAQAVWLLVGPVGVGALGATALYCWHFVRRDGFYEPVDDEEDDDGNPDGGSKRPSPPDAPPDGGGSLEFDWEGFLSGFWGHVEGEARQQRQRVGVSASSGPAG